jgi:CTP synthase (UTP-ammonia lyase)
VVGILDPENVARELDEQRLASYKGIFIATSSPYRSMDGALAGIRFARKRGVPLVGIWGGFSARDRY